MYKPLQQVSPVLKGLHNIRRYGPYVHYIDRIARLGHNAEYQDLGHPAGIAFSLKGANS
jgi:hypothetical protein